MTGKSGKTIEQVMEDLDNMLSGIGKGKNKNSGNGSGGSGNGGSQNTPPASFKSQALIVAIVLCLVGLYSSYYQVQESQQGVVTRFGAFDHIADPGPHFKFPFGIDQVYKVQVTRVHELQFGFRKDQRLSNKQSRLESVMLTGDLNVAFVGWILNYRVSDPKKFIFHAVNVEKNIRDISISVMRQVVGDKLVSDILTTDRVSIADRALKLTQDALDVYDMGILVTKIALQNVTPPEKVKPAFNEVNIARQEKERMINEAQGIYNRVIPEAEGKANKLVSEAEAYSIRAINRAKGDADNFKQIFNAYKIAPKLTRKRMYLEAMQDIFGREGIKLMIVDPDVKGLLPVFQNQPGQAAMPSAPKNNS